MSDKKKYQYVRETETYNGKQYVGWGKTKAEARRKLAYKVDAVKRGDIGIGDGMTVLNWVNTWLSTYGKPRIRQPGEPKLRGTMTEATYKEYEQLCQNYVVPSIGNMRMRDVTTPHLQQILNESKGMSFSHVSKLNITIKKMFKQATIDRIIPYNPADGLTLPATKKGKRRSLTAEEKRFFFKAADKNTHGLLFRFLMATGLRPNELAAIRIGDIDLDQKIVHVTQAVETGSKEVSTPKTASGIRFTVINTTDDPTIIADIKALIAEREVTEFLFTKKDGGMLTRQAFKVYWQSFCRTWNAEMMSDQGGNGQPLSDELVTYCLRHTFGTDMQRGDVPIEVTKFLMGHADISTTANIYVDSGKEDAIRAVGILNNKNAMRKGMLKKSE